MKGKTASIYFRFGVKQKIWKQNEKKRKTEAKQTEKNNVEAKRKIWKRREKSGSEIKRKDKYRSTKKYRSETERKEKFRKQKRSEKIYAKFLLKHVKRK